MSENDIVIWRLAAEVSILTAGACETALEMTMEETGIYTPTLSYFEIAGKKEWLLEIFFPGKPEKAFIDRIFEIAQVADIKYELAPVEDKDWVTESQKLRVPVHAGRFFVYGSHDADHQPDDTINLLIDAGQAFGTGSHETTSACLEIIDNMEALNPSPILDLGAGTGVLALAAHKVWPEAQVFATDIDPIAVSVSNDNNKVNNAVVREIGSKIAGIATLTADGLDDPAFDKEGPFELVIANILAGPLIGLAPQIKAVMTANAQLILSGLLITQIDEVLAAYQQQGLDLRDKVEKGDWAALLLAQQ